MKLIIDIVLILIVVLCTWSGYRKGLVAGIASILAIVIALLGGIMLSETYSSEVIPALEPFVEGYVDSSDSREIVIRAIGYGNTNMSLNDILAEDSSLKYDYAYECMRLVGFHNARASELAVKAVNSSNTLGLDISDAVVDVICNTATRVLGTTVAFLMILILMVAVANVFNLSLRIPNLETLDDLGGLTIGFIEGFFYCILLTWFLSFAGLIIGRNTLGGTTLGQFFLNFKFITNGLL